MSPLTHRFETTVQSFEGTSGIKLVGDVGGPPAAETIVLLHGGGQTRHSWHRAVRALLREGYRVVNLDIRGHGDSGWARDGDYSVEVLSSDLEGVVRTLSSRPTIVGASLGGITSLHLLGQHPDLASALVLVDIVPRINARGRERVQSFMASHAQGFASVDEAMLAVQAYNPARQRGTSAGLMKNLRQRADGRLYWHWDPQLLSDLNRVDPPERAGKLEQGASRIKVPALLVRGLRSDIVTDEGVLSLKALMPQLKVCDVADASHMVAGDENDIFNHAILNFLREHRHR